MPAGLTTIYDFTSSCAGVPAPEQTEPMRVMQISGRRAAVDKAGLFAPSLGAGIARRHAVKFGEHAVAQIARDRQ